MDHSSSLTSQAKSTVRVHMFVYVRPEILIAECIVRFLGSKVTSKGVIMVFLQDFSPKSLNLEYKQYRSFVEELSSLRAVADVNISIKIWLSGGQLFGYFLREGVSLQ